MLCCIYCASDPETRGCDRSRSLGNDAQSCLALGTLGPHVEQTLQPHLQFNSTSDIISSLVATKSVPASQERVSLRNSASDRACNMNESTQSTLVLLLFISVVFNGIRYWRRVSYASKVGSFIWITHRGILLCYVPGFAIFTTKHSCQVPLEGSPRHALCQIPFFRPRVDICALRDSGRVSVDFGVERSGDVLEV